MSGYQPYPEYKDSGVEWFGEVPAHWKIVPLYGITSSNPDTLPDSIKNSDGFFEYIDISAVDHVSGISDGEKVAFSNAPSRARRLAKAGNVVVSTVRTYLKAVAEVLPEKSGCVFSTGFAVLRPSDKLSPGALKWLMLNDLLIQSIEAHSEGLSYPAINTSSLLRLPVALPTQGEQKQIATFLDRETNRIDKLIEKKQRFVELLQEKRQAVITQAVTKGLDPNVPLKDSGVKAIGKVPRHWEILPLRTVMRKKKSLVGSSWPDYKLLSLTKRGVIERDVSENFGKFPESFETYQFVAPNDLVMCLFDIDETPRTVGLSDEVGMITGAYSLFVIERAVMRHYLYYLFLHLDQVKGLRPYYSGLRKTIRPANLLRIRIPIPPEEEAARIVNHIKASQYRFDTLIVKTRESLDLLKERRSALITAAVTGKIDVRSETT